MKIPKLAKGVVVEQVGSDFLVIAPGSLDAVRLTGEAAETLSKIQSGIFVDSTSPVVGELSSFGILEAQGVSRRGLIKAGAIGAGAGIAVMAMPGVAAASSQVGAAGIYQVVGSDVQFRVPLSELGALSAPGLDDRGLTVTSLGISGQGSPGDDGTFAYWTGWGAAPASGTITGVIIRGAVSVNVTFTPAPNSFDYYPV